MELRGSREVGEVRVETEAMEEREVGGREGREGRDGREGREGRKVIGQSLRVSVTTHP